MKIILILVLLSVTILVAMGIVSLGLHALSEIAAGLKGVARTRRTRSGAPLHVDGDVGTVVLPRAAQAGLGGAVGFGGAAALEMCRDVAFIATDGSGRIILFNRGAEELLGIRNVAVRGQPLTTFFDAGELQVLSQILEATEGIAVRGFDCLVAQCRTGAVEEQEWTWIDARSSRFPIRLTVTALRKGEKATGFLFVARKSTDAEKAVSPSLHVVPEAAPAAAEAAPAVVPTPETDRCAALS